MNERPRWVTGFIVVLGTAGLVWPAYVVLTHRVDGPAWWVCLLAAWGCGLVAAMIAHVLNRVESRAVRRRALRIAMGLRALGCLASGTLLGLLVALIIAPFTGQVGLMPAIAVLGLYCMTTSRNADFGLTGFSGAHVGKRGSFQVRAGEGPDLT
ncbi:hypothetical protein ACFWY5_42660 [Nonomuraea sp. NPDC059007]|uniref:hypothetical protein n=1 Tax=Nonomuraea sp. NPDC059007 TaxID=3346692 RepID=UPI0036CD3AD0